LRVRCSSLSSSHPPPSNYIASTVISISSRKFAAPPCYEGSRCCWG
jgi:hypothetical protein